MKSVHQIDHNSEFGYIEGTIIKILGAEVFNNTEEKTNPKNNSKGGAKNNEIALNKPPALTVICGKENIEALRGTTSWQYLNDDGTSTAVESDSLHPLQAKEYTPSLNLFPSTLSSSEPLKAYLRWDYVPDWVVIRYWSDEAWDKPDAEGDIFPVNTSVIEDNSLLPIELKDGNYIYEVTAEWNSNEKFSGTAHYSFYTVNPEALDADELSPAPKADNE